MAVRTITLLKSRKVRGSQREADVFSLNLHPTPLHPPLGHIRVYSTFDFMQTRRTTRRSLAAAELGIENDLSNRVPSRTATTSTSNANAGPSKPQAQAQKPLIAVTGRRALGGKAVLGEKASVCFFPSPTRFEGFILIVSCG